MPFLLFTDVDFVLISLIHPAGVPSICPHHRYQKSSQGSCLQLMVHGLDTLMVLLWLQSHFRFSNLFPA